MSHEPEDQPSPPATAMMPPADPQPAGSLLRLRDVQALNRAFRRLAEVQQALLDQMERAEEQRRRQRRWVAPLAGGAALLAAASLWALTQALRHLTSTPAVVEVAAPEFPEVVVNPTPVTVEAPDLSSFAATLEVLRQDLAAQREERRQDRATIADLQERLFEQQQENLQAWRLVGAGGGGAAAASSSPAPAAGPAATTASYPPGDAPAEPPAAGQAAPEERPEDSWLGATNGLLAMDGYPHLRFESGGRVPGAAALHDVTLLEWGADGVLEAVTKASRALFELHQMSGTLVITCYDGYRTQGGVRAVLPAGGLRRDLFRVRVSAWLQHFPELGALASAAAAPAAAAVREALDELVAVRRPVGYYRVASLEAVEGTRLRMVQLNRFDGAGRLVRSLEADSLEVILHPTGDVELLLHNGAIVEGGQRRPFYEDRFRVYLPRQPLDHWRGSGVPLVELP